MSINLGRKGGDMVEGTKAYAHEVHYPEISVPRSKVKGHKQGASYHAHVKLHASSVDDHNVRYAIHSIDFKKSKAQSVDEAVDNAAEETQEEKQGNQDNDANEGQEKY